MREAIPLESIVAVDIGSAYTHACLIDRVEGVYRLVAQAESPTTLGGAEHDLMLGVQRALRRIEHVAQRRLLDDRETLITPEEYSGAGIDVFAATCSAAQPLRCALIGLTRDLSIESALRACASAPAEILHTIALGRQPRRQHGREIVALLQMRPDLILIVGGTDSGHVALLEDVARLIAAAYAHVNPSERPVILFAGNQEARRPIAHAVGAAFDYRIVENVRPSLDKESPDELQRELDQLYAQRKLASLPGYRQLSHWCTAPVLASSEALSSTLRFVAERNELGSLLSVDVGGSHTSLALHRHGVLRSAIDAGVGTAFGIRRLVELVGTADIRRWMTPSLSGEQVYSQIENIYLRPYGIPQTMGDLQLIHAVARQAIRWAGRQMWRRNGLTPLKCEEGVHCDLIAARGGALAHTPQMGMVALTLLDALQPIGLSRIALDWASIWPQLGAVARIAPLAASQVLERDGFEELGTVISPVDATSLQETPRDHHALSLTILYEDGRVVEADVPYDCIRRFSLGPKERATIEVRPHREVDIGLGHPGQGGRAQVRGGSLGIIIDTRGRPVRLPSHVDARHRKIAEWVASLCP